MSVKLMTQVWDSGPADPTERFVLLALADIADEDGKCWPSVGRIADRCCMSERNARRILRKLEDAGWIAIKTQPGRNQTNLYKIGKPDTAMSARTNCPPGQMEHENRTNEALKPDTAMSAEPSLTTKNRHSCANSASRFDEFWAVYPHRGGVKRNRKGAAQKFALAVKRGVPEQTLIDGAKRYATDRRVVDGYARDPTTWLNQEGWTDEVEPSPAAGGYDPQVDRWNYIAKHGSSEGWRRSA